MDIVTTTAALAAACERLSNADYVTIDTEFIRETTYWPLLCLAQLGGPDEALAVDALADGLDLAPLFELLADPGTLKVFHAGRQDVEIFYHLAGVVPAPMFDTQIAAMVCGFGDSAGYETLVSKLTGESLDKHSRFTDWRRRPLTDRQLRYALGDVTHLRVVYDKLSARLKKTGREGWVAEEMAVLTNPDTYASHPEEAWKRLKIRSSERRFLGLVRALAAWRDREAQSRDLTRNRVLRDEVLMGIAAHPPGNATDLGAIRGVTKGFADSNGGKFLLAAVADALALPDSDLPKRKRNKPPSASVGPAIDLLKVLLKMKCENHGVAPKMVASGSDLEQIASGNGVATRAMSGWRHEIFGADAARLVAGEIALGAGPRAGVEVVERQVSG